MDEKVSIIVPIYGVEKYLNKCVDSILNQSYTNFECILVDDGSKDKCPQICDEYALKDKRVKVLHKDNGGLSSARNAGIDAATGKYIMFIDSDDYIKENMLEILINNIIRENADISMCDFEYVYENNADYIDDQNSVVKNEILSPEAAIIKLFQPGNVHYVVAWNKLYKRELWKKIRFPIGMLHEDEAVVLDVLESCNRIVTTSDKLYLYLQRDGSIMKRGKTERHLIKYKILANRYIRCAEKVPDDVMKESLRGFIWCSITDYYNIWNNGIKRTSYMKNTKDAIRRVVPLLKKYKVCTTREIISLKIFLFSSFCYKKIFLR